MAARSLHSLASAALSITLLVMGTAWAEDEAPEWGVLDMVRVRSEYRQMQELNQEFQQFRWEQDQQLQERHKTRMLTDTEVQEYGDLSAMAAPTEARSKRLAELEALSNERERRLFELRQKEERTPEETAELNELNPRYDQRMRELAALQAEFQAASSAKFEELSARLQTNLEKAVKEAAEESNLALVLVKDSVLYGGIDVTDAVLEKLNAEAESSPSE